FGLVLIGILILILIDPASICRIAFGALFADASFGGLDDGGGGLELAEIAPDRVLGVQADFVRITAHGAAQEDRLGQLLPLAGFDRIKHRYPSFPRLLEPYELIP